MISCGFQLLFCFHFFMYDKPAGVTFKHNLYSALDIGKCRFSYHPNFEAMPLFLNTGGYTPCFEEVILLTL